MKYLGIDFNIRNVPTLDKNFIPFGVWSKAFLDGADHPVSIAIERESEKISVFHTFIRGEEFSEANYRYIERFVKFILWAVGGWKIYVCGCEKEAERLAKEYTLDGERHFDTEFMQNIYEKPFQIIICDLSDFPEANESAVAIGGHLEGCRIGFDAGGSDRKVSAVIDGKSVYSEEVVWYPKQSENPDYQYRGILEAFKTAASKMPRVDAIGVSSAGVFIGNAPMASSLFIKVPRNRWDEVKTVYDRAAKEIGNVPITVANDGDVTALAGSMSLNSGSVLGIAMGTSEAAGYVASDGNVLGWLNELAFAPVDLYENALVDEWSGDVGVGCKYFSQDAVIKLAPKAGIDLDNTLSLAEKLKVIQNLANNGQQNAIDIFRSIGTYLAHTLVLYSQFYDIKYLLVLGRVASGAGGDELISECNRVIKEEYPALFDSITVMLPDEKTRRIGQSVAAASLPQINK